MHRRKSCFFVLLLLMAAVAADAQQRVFVSAQKGDDSFACSATAPCRSFAHAMTVVATGGEILALDSGGYGAVGINRAVSIVSPPGVEGSITTTGVAGISINAAGSDVTLRGLSIFGSGSGGDGIAIAAAYHVFVQSCNISAFANDGINYQAATVTYLSVSNCTITQNYIGIQATGTADWNALFGIDGSHLEYNSVADLDVMDGGRGSIRDSVVSGSSYAVEVTAGDTRHANLQVEGCVITNASHGIVGVTSGTGMSTIHVSSSLISNNGTGVLSFDPNSHIWSRSNNTLIDNGADGVFTGLFSAQ